MIHTYYKGESVVSAKKEPFYQVGYSSPHRDGGAQWTTLVTVKSEIQAIAMVNVLNGGNLLTMQLVKEILEENK